MKKTNPFKERDLTTQLLFPTISWSSMNAFLEYDKDEWYDGYVLGIRKPPNYLMKIGIEVGERIPADPLFLPTLNDRSGIFEDTLAGMLGTIKITGHLDNSFRDLPGIDEFKTSVNKDRWTQRKVDDWGQLTFYSLLYYINFKIPPEKLRLRLWAIPILESGDFSYTTGEPKMFTTKRNMLDIATFGALIKKTHKEMLVFVEMKKLSPI